MNRRNFLRSTTTTAVGLGALGLSPAFAGTATSSTEIDAIQGPVTLYTT